MLDLFEKPFSIKSLVLEWNNSHPFDLWFRKKYNIPFNSPQHRAMSSIDIAFEYQEEQIIKGVIIEEKRLEKEKEELSNGASLFKERDDKDFEDLFDNIKI